MASAQKGGGGEDEETGGLGFNRQCPPTCLLPPPDGRPFGGFSRWTLKSGQVV